MPGTPSVSPAVLAEVAAAGARDSGGVPVDLLGDFLQTVASAATTGRVVTPTEVRAYRVLGDRAAREGVALRALLDLYLTCARRLWRHLPPVVRAEDDPAAVVTAGEVMLHAADDVVAALTEGYQLARRTLVRSQEAARREFIDDLLTGTTDVVSLLHRADGFGLDLSGPHAVATVAAERAFDDGLPLIASIERAIQGIKGDAQALLASKEGRLVVVFAAPDRAASEHVVERLGATLDANRDGRMSMGTWQIALGRSGTGADAIVASYRESVDALGLAARLRLHTPVVDARDLLVYQMLLRDRVALADLVRSTLGGLRGARGGAVPLLDTLRAYYDTGQNAAACARELHLSVRAVTYRLTRIRELTGLDVDRPDDRFALHVAALGAQLLDWPTVSS